MQPTAASARMASSASCAARPQHLEAKLLHRTCDLLQTRTFECSGGKCRRAEQKFEMPVVFHASVTSAQVMPFVARHIRCDRRTWRNANVPGQRETGIRCDSGHHKDK